MHFINRTEAGKLLAEKLKKYKDKKVIVYALPRGGIVTALEIAKYLQAPLDLIITRKIGHPFNPEYAIAATAQNGHFMSNRNELASVDASWLEKEIETQQREVARRREIYLHGRKTLSPKGKIAILVDDGVATGLTLQVGIAKLRHHNPAKLIVAVPVIPKTIANTIKQEADGLITIETPPDDIFLGSIGAYYDDFSQVEDQKVINILEKHNKHTH